MIAEQDLEIAEKELIDATEYLSELYRIMRETPEYKAILEQKKKVEKVNKKLNLLMREQQSNY